MSRVKIFLMIVCLLIAWLYIGTEKMESFNPLVAISKSMEEPERHTDFEGPFAKPVVTKVGEREVEEGRPEEAAEERIEKRTDTSSQDRQKSITVLATAYYGPLPNQNNYATGSYRGDIKLNGTGTTKSGKEVKVGHIAADWSVLPQGTKVYVPGYGNAVVEDIGSAIKGRRIDVFMGYGERGLRKATRWGRRWITITVKE